ncbi:hypothetical protein AB0945_33275 [Streptomyces sp. NPDC005474]|uniref:hypothetical protein n=1 Tax=Streptomyces sp. NPDC005474 TaxID=3154878 RepID=UPI003451414F
MATWEQTVWEWEHLRIAVVIGFWFCVGAVQPVALYEFGAYAARVLAWWSACTRTACGSWTLSSNCGSLARM